MGSPAAPRTFSLSTTQRGAIGESVAGTGLMLASGGRLSPYKPIADDDGVDLLLVDKQTRAIVQLQVKCRTKVDVPKTQSVQFDIQLNTFAEDAKGYVLCILLDAASLRKAWLFPLTELRSVARTAAGKLVIVASAREHTEDRFWKYRHDNFETVARMILGDDVAAPTPRS